VKLSARLCFGYTRDSFTCLIPSSCIAVLAEVPSVFRRNLQCQPVRGVNFREECHWSHACSLQANMRGIQWHPRV
jgi:hypothetical protein